MTKPANAHDKPSPADTPTKSSVDEGHKAKLKKSDKEYQEKAPHKGDIAQKHEKEEQPLRKDGLSSL